MGKKKNRYAKYGYLFCLPFTIAFILFMLYPILYTLIIGFTDLKGLGMTNFKILEDPFASVIIPLCRHEIAFEDDLLLQGLLIIYQKNQKKNNIH